MILSSRRICSILADVENAAFDGDERGAAGIRSWEIFISSSQFLKFLAVQFMELGGGLPYHHTSPALLLKLGHPLEGRVERGPSARSVWAQTHVRPWWLVVGSF